MRLINHTLAQEGSMRLINNMHIITRVYGTCTQVHIHVLTIVMNSRSLSKSLVWGEGGDRTEETMPHLTVKVSYPIP